MSKDVAIVRTIIAIAVALTFVTLAGSAAAVQPSGKDVQTIPQGRWWETQPQEEETSPYYDSIPYWEIAPTLREIEKTSNRVKVEVIGQSAEGRDLYLVTLSSPDAMGRLGGYQALRQLMVKDPVRAQAMMERFEDFKVPFYIHASIHGDEYPGVDASIELIRTLAYSDEPEVRDILDNVILLVNVVANPDGRVHGIRENGNGFDLNRDFITLSQPETGPSVRIFREWMPMVVLDIHGFVEPMLIEPTTPPHNPSYEYDLYIKWAFSQAEAMEAELLAKTGFEALIPFRDWDEGWDDWPPIFTPMYAMYHGAYGHTLETPYEDERGVDAHYWAVWGALKFVAANRMSMVRDQVEMFKRGFLDLPQEPIPEEILERTPYEQYDFVMEFPEAYVIPAVAPWQENPHQATSLVDFLLFNGVEVERATSSFLIGDDWYPAGSYIVWTQQPRRGLASVILEDGMDISYYPGLTMYDISAWSHPLLWGVTRVVVWDTLTVATSRVTHAAPVKGIVVGGRTAAFAYLPTSNEAVRATNDLLGRGITLLRSTEPFQDRDEQFGTGTFILPATAPGARRLANEIASRYGLQVFGLSAIPDAVSRLTMPRIATHADSDLRFVLRDLGFPYDVVTTDDLNSGIDLSTYDVFVHSGWWLLSASLDETGKEAVISFVVNGGNYIGIGRSGVDLAVTLGLSDVAFETGGRRDNGIVEVHYQTEDLIAAQYPEDSHAFVFGPVWFTGYGPEVGISVVLESEEFFVAGFWPGREPAAGYPVVVWHELGEARVVLMGIDPIFRAHPMHTYRLVANALYLG